MIFKISHLEGIKAGKISLAFRKWKNPSVRKGSQIKTEMAVVEISNISEISLDAITAADALHAGFESLEKLLKALDDIPDGTIYKMEVRSRSEDPRIALREHTALTEQEFYILKAKLERLDKYSKDGAWTIAVLSAIRDNPRLRAGDLAAKMSSEKEGLKLNIRKLKNLGLTISHDVGYSISPLGEVVLKRILARGSNEK